MTQSEKNLIDILIDRGVSETLLQDFLDSESIETLDANNYELLQEYLYDKLSLDIITGPTIIEPINVEITGLEENLPIYQAKNLSNLSLGMYELSLNSHVLVDSALISDIEIASILPLMDAIELKVQSIEYDEQTQHIAKLNTIALLDSSNDMIADSIPWIAHDNLIQLHLQIDFPVDSSADCLSFQFQCYSMASIFTNEIQEYPYFLNLLGLGIFQITQGSVGHIYGYHICSPGPLLRRIHMIIDHQGKDDVHMTKKTPVEVAVEVVEEEPSEKEENEEVVEPIVDVIEVETIIPSEDTNQLSEIDDELKEKIPDLSPVEANEDISQEPAIPSNNEEQLDEIDLNEEENIVVSTENVLIAEPIEVKQEEQPLNQGIEESIVKVDEGSEEKTQELFEQPEDSEDKNEFNTIEVKIDSNEPVLESTIQEPEVESESQSEFEPETKVISSSEPQFESEAEYKPEVEQEVEQEIEQEVMEEVALEAEQQVEQEIKQEIESESVEVIVQPESEPNEEKVSLPNDQSPQAIPPTSSSRQNSNSRHPSSDISFSERMSISEKHYEDNQEVDKSAALTSSKKRTDSLKSEIDLELELLQETDDMTLTQRKEIRKKREELEKRKRLQEFLRMESSNNITVMTTNSPLKPEILKTVTHNFKRLSVKERFELAKQNQLAQEEERLAKFKNDPSKKVTTQTNATGDIKERFEMAKQNQQDQEEKRLAKIKNDPSKRISITDQNNNTSTTPMNATNKPTGDITERFELAKQNQQAQEEQRLAKIKNDPNKKLSAKKSVENMKNLWSDGSPYATSTTGDQGTHKKSMETPDNSAPSSELRRENLRDRWENALSNSKTNEQDRFQTTKLRTIASFRLTDGTGIVKKRIDEWEELFMQLAATAEQLEEFLKAAHAHASKNEFRNVKYSLEEIRKMQLDFIENINTPEEFIINDTHIYPLYLFDPLIQSYLRKSLHDSKSNYFSLSCGVYGDQSAKPPIDVFAAVIKASVEDKIYVAVTIKVVDGHELDELVYGLKKIMIVGKETDMKIFEKVYFILPMPGWEPYIADGLYMPKTNPDTNENINKISTNSLDDIPMVISQDEEGDAVEYEEEDGDEDDEEEDDDDDEDIRVKKIETCDLNDSTGKMLQVHDSTYDLHEEPLTPLEPQRLNMRDDLNDEDLAVVLHEEMFEEEIPEKVNEVSETQEIEPTTEIVPIDENQASIQENTPEPDVILNEEVVEVQEINEEALEEVQEKAQEDVQEDVQEVNQEEVEEISPEADKLSEIPITPQKLSRRLSEPGSRRSSQGSVVSDEGDGTWVNTLSPIPTNETSESNKFTPTQDMQGIQLNPSDDEDNDEGVVDDGNEEEVYNFGRTISLPTVMLARSFLPSPPTGTFAQSIHTSNKYSWPLKDEIDEELPKIHSVDLYLNLKDIHQMSSWSNLFVLQTSSYSILFTGTLRFASTPTMYTVHNDKIFEWIRGAAASGWLFKWPMKSQRFGRVTKRFFILRDHLLSYHKIKPKDEDQVFSNFYRNTMHITENTTVTVGRKFLQKSLVITTPLDTLWLKFNSGDFSTEAMKWMSELNKSIQFQQRPKLFLSKPRIESIWYHESTDFQLTSSDIYTFGEGYLKIGLFALRSVKERNIPAPGANGNWTRRRGSLSVVVEESFAYSIDIASSETPRAQYEIVDEIESQSLGHTLSIVKFYGDWILLGGNQGFLGFGILSKTKSTDGSDGTSTNTTRNATVNTTTSTVPRQSMFQPNTSTSANSTGKKVLFCVPFVSNQSEVSEEPSNTTTDTPPSPSDDNATSTTPQTTPPPIYNYPHHKSSQIETIGIANHINYFISADSFGILGLWEFPKNQRPKSTCYNPNSSISYHGFNKLIPKLAPKCRGIVNLTDLETVHTMNKKDIAIVAEKIIKVQFINSDSLVLVSTNRRLLLLTLIDAGIDQQYGVNCFKFGGWVELDRALPGLTGIFEMFVKETTTSIATTKIPKVSSTDLKDIDVSGIVKMIEWRIVENDEEELDQNLYVKSPMKSQLDSSSQSSNNKKTKQMAKKCTISRIEWAEDMLKAAFAKIKPIEHIY